MSEPTLPMVMQNVVLTQVTCVSTVAQPPWNGGQVKVAVSECQVVPFHTCVLTWSLAPPPTAMQNALLVHDTASAAGDFGSAFQLVPFHICAPPAPTAMQKVALAHEMSVSKVAGLGTSCHAVPRHTSPNGRPLAVGLDELPIAAQKEGPEQDIKVSWSAGAST
ncbi:MAG TPA: hypothetical protein VF834_00985, partial [Streptosporangiaceae bacterium]